MDKLLELKRGLKKLFGESNNFPIRMEVKSVEGNSCEVILPGGLIIPASLKVTNVEGFDLLIIPVIGSFVLVQPLDSDLKELIVTKVDEVSEVIIKTKKIECHIDGKDGKLSIKNEQISLYDLFSEVKSLVANISVLYLNPAGTPTPSTPDPQMQVALNQFEVKFKQLLK
jgi:hypothetical protein